MNRRSFIGLLSALLPLAAMAKATHQGSLNSLVFRGELVTVYRKAGREFTVQSWVGGQYGWFVMTTSDNGNVYSQPYTLSDEGRLAAEKFAERCVLKTVPIEHGSGIITWHKILADESCSDSLFQRR